MQISTGGNFLNFGYWDNNTKIPLEAQINLCKIIGKMAELSPVQQILDVGSGFSEPSILWTRDYPQIKSVCLNINPGQLRFSTKTLMELDSNKTQKN